jgi:hypothetical protein
VRADPSLFLFKFLALLNPKVVCCVGDPPSFSLVMSDVMCIVANHEEKRAGRLFRVDSALLFVMSDVIFNVLVRDCRQGLIFSC